MRESTKLRVLLVDDDPDDRFLVADLFDSMTRAADYVVETAASYGEAVALLAQAAYDVVLVDYLLGAHTGADLLAVVADDPQRPAMIVLTGHSTPEVDQLCLDAGASDLLVKDRLDAVSLERSVRYAAERQRLARLVAERELEYRTLFDASPMPMWVYDPESLHILEVNAAASRQYGYSHEEFSALRVSDLGADENQQSSAAREAGTVSAAVWQHRRKDGRAIDVEVVRNDIRLGTTPARMVLALDVSARMRAEQALRASESTLRQVLHDVADGLLVIDGNDTILFANPAADGLLGGPGRELVGTTASNLLALVETRSVKFKDPSGATRIADLRISDTEWNGADARVLVLHDVTEQRAYEHQLQLLQRAVESSNDAVLISDARRPEMPLIYVNLAFERLTGYPPEEVLGRNCRFLQGEDTSQTEREDLRLAIAESRSCVVVMRNYRKDGSMFWNRLTISPVLDDEGQVSQYVGVMSDITDQKKIEAERQFHATYDSVTGLPRYGGAEARIEQMLVRMREAGTHPLQRLVLLFVDIDNFNSINDTMGFAAGDIALRLIAERLREAAGVDAEVMRYAGDEFVVALDGVPASEDLLQLATRFCDCIAEPMAVSPVATLYLTASVGASAYPDTGDSVLDLTRQAEIATNRAKRGGRNGAFVFGVELHEMLDDRMALGGRMRDALTRGEFLLHYQPQVSAQDGALVALEALVRWNSPEFGLLPPRRFVPIAEDNGMILQLGAWVLQSACKQVRVWLDQGFSNFLVSVNVSAAQMQRPNFVADVRRVLSETGVPAGMLELELTESVLMDHADRAVRQMQELKALGLRLALDDFGIGYSSLSYLRRFPLDKLKIDQSFISDIAHDGSSAALVRAIIAMGHHLGMRVVAEGVETAAQYGYLRRNNCDEFQGHYFAAAMAAEHIPDLLRRRYLLPAGLGQETHARTLLILDDEENIRRSLMRLLRRDGYHILEAGSATEAFELLATNPVQVIVSDQRMPGMSGTEFLNQVKEMYPDTVRMVLSGFTDLASVTDAINKGAIYKFLTKPWDDEALRAQVLEAFRRYEQPATTR